MLYSSTLFSHKILTQTTARAEMLFLSKAKTRIKREFILTNNRLSTFLTRLGDKTTDEPSG